MRRLSPCLALAAAGLIAFSAAPEASAGSRPHGFAGKAASRAQLGLRHGSRTAAIHRLPRHHRHFGHAASRRGFGFGRGLGGVWPAYVEAAAAQSPPLFVQQNVAAGLAPYPSLLDLPAVVGIRSEEPAAQPVLYVINGGAERRREPPLMRKGRLERPGAKIVSVAGAGGPEPRAGGPRIVEVAVRRGL